MKVKKGFSYSKYAIIKDQLLHTALRAEIFLLKKIKKSQSVILYGGGERDRTDDLLRARQALSQLSYTPILKAWWA